MDQILFSKLKLNICCLFFGILYSGTKKLQEFVHKVVFSQVWVFFLNYILRLLVLIFDIPIQ